jgi:hypothetical protein
VGETAENQTVLNASDRQPFIHGSLDPASNSHRAHMTSFTEQVNNSPVIVSLLKVHRGTLCR